MCCWTSCREKGPPPSILIFPNRTFPTRRAKTAHRACGRTRDDALKDADRHGLPLHDVALGCGGRRNDFANKLKHLGSRNNLLGGVHVGAEVGHAGRIKPLFRAVCTSNRMHERAPLGPSRRSAWREDARKPKACEPPAFHAIDKKRVAAPPAIPAIQALKLYG